MKTRGSSFSFAITGVGYHPPGHLCGPRWLLGLLRATFFLTIERKSEINHKSKYTPDTYLPLRISCTNSLVIFSYGPCPECRHLVTLAAIYFFTSQVCKFDFYNHNNLQPIKLSCYVSWWLKEKKLLGFINHCTAFQNTGILVLKSHNLCHGLGWLSHGLHYREGSRGLKMQHFMVSSSQPALTLYAAKAALKNGLGQELSDPYLAYPARMCRAHGGLPLSTNNTILKKKFRFLSPMEKGGIKLDTNK